VWRLGKVLSWRKEGSDDDDGGRRDALAPAKNRSDELSRRLKKVVLSARHPPLRAESADSTTLPIPSLFLTLPLAKSLVMLANARAAPRALRAAAPCRAVITRQYRAPVSESSSTTTRTDASAPPTNSGTVMVRLWGGVHDMVEAFAVLRAVEREYGALREYRFLRVRI
jgi:hypothetical protein